MIISDWLTTAKKGTGMLRSFGVSADHNGFYNTVAIGTDTVIGNPLFVNAARGDFDLQTARR